MCPAQKVRAAVLAVKSWRYNAAMKYITALLAAALVVAVGSIHLTGQAGGTIYGAGTNTCASWTESRKGDTWFTAGQWVLGYVSAVNQYAHTLPARTDSRTMANWVDDYCRENPDDDVAQAANALVDHLMKP
jgi:hypothetical protein